MARIEAGSLAVHHRFEPTRERARANAHCAGSRVSKKKKMRLAKPMARMPRRIRGRTV